MPKFLLKFVAIVAHTCVFIWREALRDSSYSGTQDSVKSPPIQRTTLRADRAGCGCRVLNAGRAAGLSPCLMGSGAAGSQALRAPRTEAATSPIP